MNKAKFINDNTILNNIINNNMLKENTKSSYINCYYRLCKLLDIYNLKYIIDNPNIFCDKINSINIFTQEYSKKIYICLLSLMNYNNYKITNKDIYNQWYKCFNYKKKALYIKSINQLPNDKQIKSYFEWNELINIRDTMIDKKSKEYILISLLTYIPPRRQLDWYNVLVFNKKDPKWKPNTKINYINLGYETPYILLSEYKTARYYGLWYKKLEGPLLEILKNNYSKEEQLLFSSNKNKKYARIETFTNWTNNTLKSLLNKNDVSMNTLRHSYISYIFKNNPNMTLIERKILAKDMGHSIIESMIYNIHNM